MMRIFDMKKKLHKFENRYNFFCPGCKGIHTINDSWNINTEAMTIKPSIPVTVPNHPELSRCHSFITNGEIRFLGDCPHELKNKTVPLPEFEMWDEGQSWRNPEEYSDE